MNIVALRCMADTVTPQLGVEYAERLGITSLVSQDQTLSTALGGLTKGVSNLELTNAFAAIANGGTYVEPKLTQDSGLLEGLSSGDRTLVTSTEAQNLKTLLRTNVESYYGDWLFPAGMNVCAKTGTGEVGEGKGPNCWMVGF